MSSRDNQLGNMRMKSLIIRIKTGYLLVPIGGRCAAFPP